MISDLERVARAISATCPDLSMELTCVASDLAAYKRRGPQRTRWHKHHPNERRKRKRWLRSVGGKKYLRKHKQIEKRPSTIRYRERLQKRGPHRHYPWVH